MNHQATKAPRKLILDEPARQVVDAALEVLQLKQKNSSGITWRLGALVVKKK